MTRSGLFTRHRVALGDFSGRTTPMRIRTKRLVATFAGLVMLGVLAHTAISDDKKVEKSAAGAGGADAAMMAEMMKMNATGPQHALLKRLVGTFDADVTMKMAFDAPEMKSKGKEVNEMILSDRFLKTDYSGD